MEKLSEDMDYYQILGLDANCSQEILRQRYLQLALEFHPDKNVSDASSSPVDSTAFQKICQAWSILGSPELRKQYDAQRFQKSTVHTSQAAALHDEVFLQDLEDRGDYYQSDCRCGGSYILEKELLEEERKVEEEMDTEKKCVAVCCDTCSLCLVVRIDK